MKQYIIYFTVTCMIIFVAACKSDEKPKEEYSGQLFSEISASKSGIDFKNQITEDVNFHHLNWESVYNGGGVAIADFDNDGLEDIYLGGNQVDDAIYRNLGDWKFEDMTKKSGIADHSGWTTGISVADVNNDGWLDIYVCRMWHSADAKDKDMRRNKLFINNKGFKFTESSAKYNLDDSGHSTQASFFDYDADGDLDMYLLNAPSNNYSQKLTYIQNNKIPYEHSDKLFLNDNGTYKDVTKSTGVEDYGFGLGLVTVDLNNDGWTDIYVANDFETADRMLINQKNGTFKDEIQNKLKHISYSSMGADVSDMNNDGFADIAVLDMQSSDHYRSKTNMPSMDIQQFWKNVANGQHFQYMSNMLQINNGYGFYSEVAQLAGIASTDWSWSVLMADFDNDSWRDIYISNGLNKDIRNNDFSEEMKKFRARGPKSLFEFSQKVGSEKISNLAFKNNGGNYTFNKIQDEWGLDHMGFSFGAAYADLDQDGDLDLIVNNNNEIASIYKNNASIKHSNNWIQFLVNENGIPKENIQVYAYKDDKTYYGEQSRIRGFQSSSTPIIHFGLAEVSGFDSVFVVNNKGEKFAIKNYKLNKRNTYDYKDLKKSGVYRVKPANVTWLTEVTGSSNLKFKHSENEFNDFKRESLLPHMQSKKGPYLATTKVNNSDDYLIYIGNAHGSPGKMFSYNRTFTEIPGPWIADKAAEDMGAVFFDLENDGDMDLYVVSGGSEKAESDRLYADRLYIQQNGKWTKSNALPNVSYNGSIVVASDYDNDGDTDLFVGGRGIPGRYPYPSGSQLLVNENGNLVDKAGSSAPGLRNIGMITDAIWTDINNDEIKDLMVVGEFMKPMVFENNGRQLIEKTDEYIQDAFGGWWFTVEEIDLNNDGTNEYVLGNIGENNKFHPNESHPLQIYGNDFDKNNTNDVVLTKTTDAYGEVPVRGRECSSQQMPFIKSKFEDFDGYAKANVLDIYGEKGLKEAINLQATEFSSGILKKENRKYTFTALPVQAQISAIRDMEFADVNGDGLLDIIAVGNLFDAEVETTRHDSSIGIVMTQQKDGSFKVANVRDSGFYMPGNTRKMAKLETKDKDYLIVTNNNFVPQVVRINHK